MTTHHPALRYAHISGGMLALVSGAAEHETYVRTEAVSSLFASVKGVAAPAKRG